MERNWDPFKHASYITVLLGDGFYYILVLEKLQAVIYNTRTYNTVGGRLFQVTLLFKPILDKIQREGIDSLSIPVCSL